ncbi:MAG: hypothetical protein EOP86_14765 [Verrucomicrobiaceae bacterium]|nr:MAG: hypothetical protein EOP86_14765 [Verrucomicrobiaceae bacterium]
MAGIAIGFLISVVLNVFILCITVSVVARNEPYYSPPKITLVSIGISVANVILYMTLGSFATPLAIVLTIGALRVFCRLGWKPAVMVGILCFILPMVIGFVFSRMTRVVG